MILDTFGDKDMPHVCNVCVSIIATALLLRLTCIDELRVLLCRFSCRCLNVWMSIGCCWLQIYNADIS